MGEENLGAAGLIHNLCFHAGFGVRVEPEWQFVTFTSLVEG